MHKWQAVAVCQSKSKREGREGKGRGVEIERTCPCALGAEEDVLLLPELSQLVVALLLLATQQLPLLNIRGSFDSGVQAFDGSFHLIDALLDLRHILGEGGREDCRWVPQAPCAEAEGNSSGQARVWDTGYLGGCGRGTCGLLALGSSLESLLCWSPRRVLRSIGTVREGCSPTHILTCFEAVSGAFSSAGES